MMDRVIAIVVIACVLLLPLSILEAEWAPRAGTLVFVCAASLASGSLIAPLGWRRAIRWPLVLLAALLLAASNAGLLRMGALEAIARLTTWAADLQAGRVVRDPQLVIFWVTLLIWWSGYSASYGIASGARPLHALLPTLFALTVNSVYTGRSTSYIVVALFGLIILMVWATQTNRQTRWAIRGVDFPEMWLDWIGSGIIIAGLAATLAWTFPTVTSKSTIEWLRELLNPQTSEARKVAEQMLGGATPIPLPTDSPLRNRQGRLDLPNSHLIGNPPELSQQVVMWVWTNQPPPLPVDEQREVRGYAVRSAPNADEPEVRRPYWRGITYSTYSGRRWSNLPTVTSPLVPVLTPTLTQRFDIIAPHADTVFAANVPVSGTEGLSALYAGSDLIGLRSTLSQYTVTSYLIEADEDTLREAPITATITISPYLELPAALPQRVRELAAQIVGDAPNSYDKAIRIEAYLRTYTYTLDLPPVPEGRDLVDYFLFDAPGGYCDYYASAMVVMLRAVGVPARLASGYLTGSYDFQRGEYRVIGANAHAWPEVYFEGIGWVEFEPTASQPVLYRPRRAPPLIFSSEQVRAAEVKRAQRATLTRNVALAAGLLLLLAGVLLVYWARRERQLAALPADEAIPLLYQRLRRRGRWLGVSIRPSDTPDEFVASFNQAIVQSAPARWAKAAGISQVSAARIGELYRRASYSSRPPGAQEARQAWSGWRALSPRSLWIGLIGKLKSLIRQSPRISTNKKHIRED
jgi:transglutaminase-like putative cysteine protease